MQKASIGVRFGALLLDNIFLNMIYIVVFAFSPYLFLLVVPFGTFLYYGICEGSGMSATLGKKICGLVVVDDNGNKLTASQGFLRSICRMISSALLGIGFFIALFDEEGKALHDKIAKTFVAKEFPYSRPTPSTQQANISPNSNLNMYPKVICIAGQFAGKAFPISQQGITLGRDQNVCEFAFAENTQGISRIHCKIQFNPQTQMFVLYDLGSTYGTYLENGMKVSQSQPIALKSGEGFYLASRGNLFRVSL